MSMNVCVCVYVYVLCATAASIWTPSSSQRCYPVMDLQSWESCNGVILLRILSSASDSAHLLFKCSLNIFMHHPRQYQTDLNFCTPVAILPGACRYRVSAGAGWPGVSIQWLGEVESWICNFCLSVAAHKPVWADPSLRYARMLLGR